MKSNQAFPPRYSLRRLLPCFALALMSLAAYGLQPYKVLFDFTPDTGDRDRNFAERQPGDTYDVNGAAASGLSVVNADYLMAQNKTSVWLVLNDPNPGALDATPPANVDELKAGTNVVARTRLIYLYASANTVTNEAVSAGILFGLTGTGATRSGYLARVDRFNTAVGGTNNYAELRIDEFTNGVRGASLASAGFVYGANSTAHFLELRVTSDGVTTNATVKMFADSAIPGSGLDTNRLVDATFDTATTEASVTMGLTNYNEGFLALYAEDNSNMTANNPTADIVRFSGFYAKSGVFPSTVSIVATDSVGAEGGDSITFEISRAFPDVVTTNVALTVYYAASGTASNGVDYPSPTGEAIIPVGQTNVLVTITPTDDTESELAETLTLTLLSNTNYVPVSPISATASIADNDPTVISVYTSRASAYEPLPQLYAEFTLVRYGLTSTAPSVNVGYSGTATAGVDFTADPSVSFAAGEVTKTIAATPIDNSVYTGDKGITLTVNSGTDYTPAAVNTASATIVDDEYPPETVLWSDDFNSGTSNTNFTLTAASLFGPDDYTTNWFFDYLAAGFPPARNGSTNYGLQLSANKDGGQQASACVNLYPVGQNFSNNFALRFNLLIQYQDSSTSQENVLFGINHSGLATNFISGSYSNVVRGDGIWFTVNTMLNGTASISVSLYTSENVGETPVAVAQIPGTALAGFLPSPPFTIAGGVGIDTDSVNKTWVDVELSQVDGIITLKINHSLVLQVPNGTAYKSGNIMLGYDDAFNSVSDASTYALFDNVRVVELPSLAPPVVTGINVNGTTVQVDFTSGSGYTAANFKLQHRAELGTGSFADDDTATITTLGPGVFRATTTTSGPAQFYRIKR